MMILKLTLATLAGASILGAFIGVLGNQRQQWLACFVGAFLGFALAWINLHE